ncbi:Hsp70 family protein [Actinophytocola glycyrrhizae]|uniref:Hsp70 family protein n=1 Tax=Actinophytocola glycyrrhizae TaxID=2044873 RepID=A0ABV9S9M3_9PSEU
MSGAVVGVDVGSRGLRIAWTPGGEQPAEVTDLPPTGSSPWVGAVLSPRSIGFVSVRELRSPAAVDTLTSELARACATVRGESGADVSRAVLSVPTRLGSADRTKLRDAARAAGFAEVHLINDSVAAALADGSGEPRTVLVYSLGHSGFETGLLRVARRQVRVLGHAGAMEPSGLAMDTWLMQAWLGSLSGQDVEDLNTWDAPRWARLREVAEQVKVRLAGGDRVTLAWPPWSSGDGPSKHVETPSPEEFGRYLDEQVAGTAKHVREVIADAGMTSTDIDAVLRVGEASALTAVRAMLEAEAGSAGSPAEPYRLARGAAVYGSYLRPPAVNKDAEFVDPQDTAARPVLAVRIPEGPAGGPPDVFEEVRRLWAGGATDEARTLLTKLVDRANRMLAEMDRPAPSSAPESVPESVFGPESARDSLSGSLSDSRREEPMPASSTPEQRDRARRAIRRADRLLRKGQLQKAVDESHHALKQASDDGEIFAGMIGIHVDAARARPGPAGYAEARLWLGCARNHARFNETVAAYIVERTLEYARHQLAHDQVDDARRLLEECMFYELSDPGVRELAEELAARTRN